MSGRPMVLPDTAIDRIALYFRALSDPMRLRILNSLRESERSVGELAQITETSQANVSKHLRVLADAGIVSRTAQGNSTLIGIADPTIYGLCTLVCDSIARELEKNFALHKALKNVKRTSGASS
jgi:DNA-binding transcriptional ArsR family regulator